MAKTSAIERNKKRVRMVKSFRDKRTKLKAIAANRALPIEERFAATLKLAQMPRNSSRTRIHNRCELTGRPARRLSQIQAVPHQAQGTCLDWHDPGRGQVQLVRLKTE